MKNILIHHGIIGQKWGVRRYQNADGSLTAAGYARYQKKTMKQDVKWVKRNDKKITNYAKNATRQEMNDYVKNVLNKKYSFQNRNGKGSKNYANAYNKKLAELMNKSIEGLETPNGRIVTFVAKRGEMGVYTAVADKGYDMGQVRNGVYGSGRVAYKKTTINRA